MLHTLNTHEHSHTNALLHMLIFTHDDTRMGRELGGACDASTCFTAPGGKHGPITRRQVRTARRHEPKRDRAKTQQHCYAKRAQQCTALRRAHATSRKPLAKTNETDVRSKIHLRHARREPARKCARTHRPSKRRECNSSAQRPRKHATTHTLRCWRC